MPTDRSDIEILARHLARIGPEALDRDLVAEHLKRLPSQRLFLDHCIQRGLAPLVFRNLKAFDLAARLDAEIWNQFRKTYYGTLAGNLRLFEDLREIAREAGKRRMPLIVLKGPALVHLIYEDPGLRPMTDIDLLVRPVDLARLKETAAELGYTPVPLYPDLYLRGQTVLDLHTDPINRSRIEARQSAIGLDLDALWQSARPLPDFQPLQLLALNDQILTLSVHALKHGYQQTIWLVDIAGCVRLIQTAREWGRLIQRARASGTLRILALTLHAVRDRLEGELPAPAVGIVNAFRPALMERLLLDMAIEPGMLQLLEPLVLAHTLKRTRQKVACLLEMAFPRPGVLAQISGLKGAWSFWLSYPYRLVQLLGMTCKYAFAAGRHLFRK